MENFLKLFLFFVAAVFLVAFLIAHAPLPDIQVLEDLKPYSIGISAASGATGAFLQLYTPLIDYRRKKQDRIKLEEERRSRSEIQSLISNLQKTLESNDAYAKESSKLSDELQRVQRALAQAPAETARRVLLALEKGDTSELAEWMESETEVAASDLAQLQYLLGCMARAKGNWDLAIYHLEKAKELEPTNESYGFAWHSVVVRQAAGLGNFRDALATFRLGKLSKEAAYAMLATQEALLRECNESSEAPQQISQAISLVLRAFPPQSELCFRAIALGSWLTRTNRTVPNLVDDVALLATRLAPRVGGLSFTSQAWARIAEAEQLLSRALLSKAALSLTSDRYNLRRLIERQEQKCKIYDEFRNASLPLSEAGSLIHEEIDASAIERYRELFHEFRRLLPYIPQPMAGSFSGIESFERDEAVHKQIMSEQGYFDGCQNAADNGMEARWTFSAMIGGVIAKAWESVGLAERTKSDCLRSLESGLDDLQNNSGGAVFDPVYTHLAFVQLYVPQQDFRSFIDDVQMSIPQIFHDDQEVIEFLANLQNLSRDS
jgi:tetratricopeptide (TPR) repeat protein